MSFDRIGQSVQSLSCVWLFATPWITARQASPSITNSQSLLKPMFIEPVMPSNHLILCRPLLVPPSISPSIRVFSNESAVPIRWPKYWNLNFSNNPSNEYSVLVSFRIDLLDLTVQGLSRVSSNTTGQTWLSPPDASTAKRHFHFGPVNSSFLELLVIAVCSSPVVYLDSFQPGGLIIWDYLFAFSFCPRGSHNKNPGMDCYFLLQGTTFCQNSSLWPIPLGWPYAEWLQLHWVTQAPSPWQGCGPWKVYFLKKFRQRLGVKLDYIREKSKHSLALLRKKFCYE